MQNLLPETATKLESMIREIAAYNGNGANMQFARAYAQTWLKGERNKTQLLYIRANLSGWRGERAKYIRQFIDQCLEQNK